MRGVQSCRLVAVRAVPRADQAPRGTDMPAVWCRAGVCPKELWLPVAPEGTVASAFGSGLRGPDRAGDQAVQVRGVAAARDAARPAAGRAADGRGPRGLVGAGGA